MSYENEIANEFVSAPKRATQNIYQATIFAERLKVLFGGNSYQKQAAHQQPTQQPNMPAAKYFTGQFTDLDFFNGQNTMPMSVISNIPDPQLKAAVIDNFERFAADGLVTIDNTAGTISITDKGKTYISDPTFVRSAAITQSSSYMQWLSSGLDADKSLCVELCGDSQSDFTAFDLTDTIDLQQIAACPNNKAVNRIFANIESWKSDGLIRQGIGNTVQLTEKGREALADILKTAPQKAAAKKALSAASGGNPVIYASIKAAQKAVDVLNNAVQTPTQTR